MPYFTSLMYFFQNRQQFLEQRSLQSKVKLDFCQTQEKHSQLSQLSQRQKNALAKALWLEETANRDSASASCMKQLLLRAYVIYQRRDQLTAEALSQYHDDLKRRLNKCLELHNKQKRRFIRYYAPIPYYLFWFLEARYTSSRLGFPIQPKKTKAITRCDRKPLLSFSHYHTAWIRCVRFFLAVCTKNSQIVKLKKLLGCISLIPIKVREQPIKVRGIWLNYHDLYHLEVAQLERIQMGKDWVSGIHGINRPLFHDFPIEEEYDSFLDEARIAIHEGLTRPSAFSQLKALCWLILLLLQGINSFAVIIRHWRSLKKKQQQLIF